MFEELLERKFRIDLFEKDKNPRVSFSKLKYTYDYPTACRIVDNLPNMSPYQDWVYGESLPKEIGHVANAHIISSNANLKDEINWILLSVRKYKDELNKFIEYKHLYDNALIRGEYEKAEDILNQIENEICISLWSIENRFLIIELRKGLKENTSFLNEINTQNKKGFIRYFAHFFSLKAEKELSVNRYEVSLLKFLLPLIQKEYNEDFEYYLIKLNPFFQNIYNHLPTILAYENYNSIIDKYLTLIKVFQMSIIGLKNDDKDLKELLSSRLFYLKKKLNDPTLYQLSDLLVEENQETSPNINDAKCIKALDLYTSGKYFQSEIESRDIIKNNPLFIEVYPIYVKSIILQNKPLEMIGDKSSFQQIILSALYDLYKKEKNPADSGIVLRKIAYNLSGIRNISYFIMNVVKQEIENDSSFEKISIIQSSFLNPRLALLHSNQVEYLKEQLRYFPNSSTIKLALAAFSHSLDTLKESEYSMFKIGYHKAINLQNDEKHLDASKIWEELLAQNSLSNFQLEKVLTNLFFCKAKLQQFDYCLHLYLDYYFKNKYIIQKLNVEFVKEQIKQAKYKNVTYSIELPLFFFLTGSDDYDIHTAYECFLLSTDSEKPSELITKTKNFDKNIIFFLKNICTLDIFKHSPFITSTHTKLSERITICQVLKSIDPDNKSEYIEEESLLSKKIIIQKGLQEIDESKIYVNQTSIIQNELKDLESVYNRYIAISELSSEKNVFYLNPNSEEVFSLSSQEQDIKNNEFSKDPQYDIFKEMFFDIRDKFLYSKYGLKLYLSARIRHGVLLGEIRPEFELLHLVTEKEKASGNYKANEYWRQTITAVYGNSVYEQFNRKLSVFSQKIDNLINTELLDKYLLIKTEKENPDGWFDYEFPEWKLQVIYLIFSKFKKEDIDYNRFVNMIFEELWVRTTNNLKSIQYNIRNNIRDAFFNAIQDLEKSLHELSITTIPELQNNLTDVKVKIENKLDKIALWFTITDTQISDFEFNKIIEVCCESLHNHYTSKELVLTRNINCCSLLKGEYYTHFVDLLRIFFQNILDYTSDEKVAASIDVEKKDNLITIKIENTLREDEDIEELKKKINIDIDIKKSQLDKQSGLYKALNIVKTNFENEKNDLSINIIEDKFSVLVTLYSENILV